MTVQVGPAWSASCSSLIWKNSPRLSLSWYRRFRSSRPSGSIPTRSSWTSKSAGPRWQRDRRRTGSGFATISSSLSKFRRKRRFQWAFLNKPTFPWLWSPGYRACPRWCTCRRPPGPHLRTTWSRTTVCRFPNPLSFRILQWSKGWLCQGTFWWGRSTDRSNIRLSPDSGSSGRSVIFQKSRPLRWTVYSTWHDLQ